MATSMLRLMAYRKYCTLQTREVILSLLPLFHAYSQIVNLWLATVIERRIVYLNEINSEENCARLERGRRDSAHWSAAPLVSVFIRRFSTQ